MSLRRPTVASLLFIFIISPLRDVAQMSDCGITVIYFHYKPFPRCRVDARLWHALSFTFQYKPFMWCRPDARLRHVNLFISPFEESFQTPDRFSAILLGFREDYRLTSFLFNMSCKFIIWVCITNLFMCIMRAFVIYYVQTVLRVHSKYSPACRFGQMLTKAILWMKSTIASPEPRGVPVSPVRSWNWSLVSYTLLLPK